MRREPLNINLFLPNFLKYVEVNIILIFFLSWMSFMDSLRSSDVTSDVNVSSKISTSATASTVAGPIFVNKIIFDTSDELSILV